MMYGQIVVQFGFFRWVLFPDECFIHVSRFADTQNTRSQGPENPTRFNNISYIEKSNIVVGCVHEVCSRSVLFQ